MNKKNIKGLVDAEIASSESTKDEPYPENSLFERRNNARSTVYSVRLNAEEVAEIQQAAEAAHLPAATLVRSWIKEHLNHSHLTETRLRKLIHDEVEAAVKDALQKS